MFGELGLVLLRVRVLEKSAGLAAGQTADLQTEVSATTMSRQKWTYP